MRTKIAPAERNVTIAARSTHAIRFGVLLSVILTVANPVAAIAQKLVVESADCVSTFTVKAGTTVKILASGDLSATVDESPIETTCSPHSQHPLRALSIPTSTNASAAPLVGSGAQVSADDRSQAAVDQGAEVATPVETELTDQLTSLLREKKALVDQLATQKTGDTGSGNDIAGVLTDKAAGKSADGDSTSRIAELNERLRQVISQLGNVKDAATQTRMNLNEALLENARLDQIAWSSRSAIDKLTLEKKSEQDQRRQAVTRLTAGFVAAAVVVGGILLGLIAVYVVRRRAMRTDQQKNLDGMSENIRWNRLQMINDKLLWELSSPIRPMLSGSAILSAVLLMIFAVRSSASETEIVHGATLIGTLGSIIAFLVAIDKWHTSISERIVTQIRLEEELLAKSNLPKPIS